MNKIPLILDIHALPLIPWLNENKLISLKSKKIDLNPNEKIFNPIEPYEGAKIPYKELSATESSTIV